MEGKRAVLALLLAGVCFPAGALGFPQGYPGSSWGSFTRGDEDTEGAGAQGWARQGVRWARLPGGASLDTYGVYNWRVRTRNKTYYNVHGPSLVAALDRSPFSAGAEFAWLRYPERSLDAESYSLFAGLFVSRDIAKWTGYPSVGSYAPEALPFSIWTKMSYDLHGEEGSGSMGWVKQGVDWFSVRGWKFITFGAYNWRLRDKNRTYYDVYGPSAGVVFKNRTFDLGADCYWQSFPQLSRRVRTLQLFLGWYAGWDLKGR